MVEINNKQIEQQKSYTEGYFKIAQLLLAGIGIFAALCYFLGRLYTEAYYYALGITPHVLKFNYDDYMFSSFNLVIMCLEISTWLYMYWGWSKQGRRLILGFPIAKGSRIEIINSISMLISLLLTCGFLAWNLYSSSGIGLSTPGIMGLNAGLLLGVGIIIFTWSTQTIAQNKKFDLFAIIITALLLFAYVPTVTNRLAEIDAKVNMNKFPTAIVVLKDELPAQLQSSSSNSTKSVEGRLVITNNGMTYVLQSDNVTTYAIPMDNIKDMVYLNENKTKKE